MASLNKIILVGEIISKPDIKATSAGDSFARFTIKTDRPSTDGMPQQSDEITVVAWRDLAESLENLTVGQTALVDGRITIRTVDDDAGNRKWLTEVEAREIKALNGSAIQSPVKSVSKKIDPVSIEEKDIEPLQESDFNFEESDSSEVLEEEVPF